MQLTSRRVSKRLAFGGRALLRAQTADEAIDEVDTSDLGRVVIVAWLTHSHARRYGPWWSVELWNHWPGRTREFRPRADEL